MISTAGQRGNDGVRGENQIGPAPSPQHILVPNSTHIANFMGSQIVSRGGYSESLQGITGWGVHIGVSIACAALFAGLALLSFVSQRRPNRWAFGLALAGALSLSPSTA